MAAASSAVADAKMADAQSSASLSTKVGLPQAAPQMPTDAPQMPTDRADGTAGPGPGGGEHAGGGGRQEAAALLVAQQAEVMEQLLQLQRVLEVQTECTGRHALEEEVAARVLGDSAAWQKPAEELPAPAAKALEEAFSLKDSVTKAEARDLGTVLGITPGQVKDFFVAHRAHTRAWLRSMHPGALKGRPQRGAHSNRPPQDRQAGPPGKEPGSDRGKEAPGAKAEVLARVEKEEGGREGLGTKKGGFTALKGVAESQGAEVGLPGPSVAGGLMAGGDEGAAGRLSGQEHNPEQDTAKAESQEKEPQSGAQPLQPAVGLLAAEQLVRVADTTGGAKPNADGLEPVLDHLPQLDPIAVGNASEAAVQAGHSARGPPAEGHTKNGSRSAGPPPEKALPREPFQPPQQPRGILIDLNAPPEDLAEETPGGDFSTSIPKGMTWSAVSPAGSSPQETAALALGAPARWAAAGAPRGAQPQAAEVRGVLALGAPEKQTGAGLARRVQPEATDLRGALAQLVGARGAGHAEEEGAARWSRVMRRESSVAGRLQVLEALARGRKRVVQARLLDGAGLLLLHQWLVEAYSEEQTTLLRALLQVLALLPPRPIEASPIAPLARTLLKVTRYFVPDVAALARQLLVCWKRGRAPDFAQKSGHLLAVARQPGPQPGSGPVPPISEATAPPKIASPVVVERRDAPPPSLVRASLPLRTSAAPPVAALAAPPSPKRGPRSGPPGRTLPGPSGVAAKRAGSPLGPPPAKQPRHGDRPEQQGMGRTGGKGRGDGQRGGKFAELLRRGRQRDSNGTEVAALLQDAVAVRGGAGEKPLSADDILKAKAREQLIRQMQGRNGRAADQRSRASGGARGDGQARVSRLAGNGGTERPFGADGRETTTAQQERLPEQGAPHAQAAAAASHSAGPVHGNGGPPLPTTTESASSVIQGTWTPDPGYDGGALPGARLASNSAGPLALDVAAISALAHALQVATPPTQPGPSAPPPASAVPSRQPVVQPAHVAAARPANPLLAQLVAEMERQKRREAERREREGPHAALSAEAQQSAALLQQLEAHVTALLAQERRSAAPQKGGEGGAWARAVALMEDRAIPWQVPPAVWLDPAWSVPAGEDSEEASRRTHEAAATLAAVYPSAALIPDQPRAPPVSEPESDDALTPEITTLDLKQQQQQQQAAAEAAGGVGDGEEDAEYQAALAEAYGPAQEPARSSSGAADATVGRQPSYGHEYVQEAPRAAPFRAAEGALGRWGRSPGPPLWAEAAARPTGRGYLPPRPGTFGAAPSAPPHYLSPPAHQSWPRGPQYARGRAPLDRTQTSYAGQNSRPAGPQYGTRPGRNSWRGW
ncbi:hypothetical protein KFL_006610050 [Klebsormidium nitens]|uniref:Homeobox domain-containing protein n=1 Tax=Klebsormidium nitens TaxID=105231 RepID=A0A1Y1IIH7_KLENI|nr:hypothetical protein KFL_006610050 [Klebsormidium nitens]|eukprot:GAQ90604.1 hypothetical protein KFL_006610050 [Klebsormidium nitens]